MWFSCANGTRFQLDEQDRDLADGFNWWGCRDPRSGEVAIRRNTSRAERAQGAPKKIALHKEVAQRKGILPPALPDHMDRDKTNNCRNNIRPATQVQNQWNRRKMPRNGVASSPYKGVSFAKNPRAAKNPWRCSLAANGKRNQSFHATELEAAHRFDELARKYHGEFAVLNFPIFEGTT